MVAYRHFMRLSINNMIGYGLIENGVFQTGPNGNVPARGCHDFRPFRLRSNLK
jgi:hypothetical protein